MVYDAERARRARLFGGPDIPPISDPRWSSWADRFLRLFAPEGVRFRELAYATGSPGKTRNLLAYLELHGRASFHDGRWEAIDL